MQYLYRLIFTSSVSLLMACGGGGGGSPSSSGSIASASSSSSLSASSSSASSSSTTSASTSSSSSSIASSLSSSITNVPSSEVIGVDAGKDQTLPSGVIATLTATATGTGLAPFTYQWSQVSGTSVSLNNASTATTSFTTATTSAPEEFLFKVIATDKNGKTYTDTVKVFIGSGTIYEAETATLSGALSVVQTHAGYSGTGYVTSFTVDTDAITWPITIATSGFYKIDIRYQLDTNPKGFNLSIDSAQTSGTFTDTAGDKLFHTLTMGTFWLAAGSHTIKINGGWHFYNIDNIQLTLMPTPTLPQAVDATPADPNANAKTKALYTYMIGNYGSKTLSGQQDAAEMQTILTRSGKLPAIFALDTNNYDSLAVAAQGAPTNQTENFIATLNTNKQIGSIIWHWHSPTDAKNTANPCPNGNLAEPNNNCWWDSFYTAHTNFNLTAALADTNSAQYKALINDIDLIAIELKKIQTAGLPLLFRPLHEADGGWFWWGAYGADSYKKLWRIMHDRLTNYHQIHNLLWVATIGDPNWYAGDDVVDFVGVDAYPSDKHDIINSAWNLMLERFDGHKMLVLSEFGGVPFIDEMQSKGVWWGYFASWNDVDINSPLGPKKMTVGEVNAIYNLSGVITADELVIP